jgi:hypothetical protein
MSSVHYLAVVFDGFLIPLLASFGVLGNIASIFMLRSPKLDMKVSFRYNADHQSCGAVSFLCGSGLKI